MGSRPPKQARVQQNILINNINIILLTFRAGVHAQFVAPALFKDSAGIIANNNINLVLEES